MRTKFDLRAVLLVLLVTVFAFAATPLSADATAAVGQEEVIVFSGYGTIAPGYTTTPTYQTSMTWSSQALIYAGQINGAGAESLGATCNFNGASTIPETLLAGEGSGSMVCSGGIPDTLSLNGNLRYARTGYTVTLSGSFLMTVNGQTEGCTVTAAAFQMVPTSLFPIVNFRFEGAFLLLCS